MKRNFRTFIQTARGAIGPGRSRKTEGFKRKIELISSQMCLNILLEV